MKGKVSNVVKKQEILFMHDIHSHIDSFKTIVNKEEVSAGGFARIKTLINEKKKKNPNALVIDGGDFSMGTLMQTAFVKECLELRMLGDLECDVTTIGNHEFDYGSKGLSEALNTAIKSGDNLPKLVLGNIDWKGMTKRGLTIGQQLLKNAFEKYGLKDYITVNKGDIKIVIFGLFGKHAYRCSNACELKFRDSLKAARDIVDKIKAKENPDMIICLSHSGTFDNLKMSEDENLAKNIPEIDIIVSAHTHTTLTKPICYGDTYIVSCGCYGINFGNISMEQKENGRWKINEYELIPITEEIKENDIIKSKIKAVYDHIDQEYLLHFGYRRNQVLAKNRVNFSTVNDLLFSNDDQNLGNLLSDAFRYAVEKCDKNDTNPVDIVVVPAGCVRDTFSKGYITVENVFNSYSLGMGYDKKPVFPLASSYLTGKELKLIMEIDASATNMGEVARLYTAGLKYTYNVNKLLLNRVTQFHIMKKDGKLEPLEDKKLYRVVADLGTARMLKGIREMSFGLINLKPKDNFGRAIKDLESAIIYNNDKELKAWVAIAMYIQSFPDTDGDGIADIPYKYSVADGRRSICESRPFREILLRYFYKPKRNLG